VDGKNLEEFSVELDQQLDQLHIELKGDTYQPRPVRQVQIPKVGKPGEYRMLGVPTIYDRVCQPALLNRIEPIFEPVFDEANFGYRRAAWRRSLSTSEDGNLTVNATLGGSTGTGVVSC
jgi:retron-type reverse transcriptase